MALWVTLPVFLCSDGVLFCAFGSAVLPSLMDRLGDAKDQVRDQDQTLLIKIMDQAAIPQVRVCTHLHTHTLTHTHTHTHHHE